MTHTEPIVMLDRVLGVKVAGVYGSDTGHGTIIGEVEVNKHLVMLESRLMIRVK